MQVGVAASPGALRALAPLLEAYQARFELRIFETAGEAPAGASLLGLAEQVDALLLVGPRRRAPRTVLPGPALRCGDGRWVPVGWLPDVGAAEVSRFAHAAAQVHRRASLPNGRAVAVLSQWNPRYLHLAHRIEGLLNDRPGTRPVLRWSGDQLMREDLIRGLHTGLAAAFYVGHGRPVGWVGYHGTRAHHFQTAGGSPLGVLFSLCCATASRRRTALSFSEAIPLMGKAAAAFGAVNATLHADNTRWALGLCGAMNNGVDTLGQLIVQAMPTSLEAITGYRILGDPVAPLSAHPDAHQQAEKIGRYDDCFIT